MNYLGNIHFDSRLEQFSLQIERIRTLTKLNDIKLEMLGDSGYFAIMISRPRKMDDTNILTQSNMPERFLCFRKQLDKESAFNLYFTIQNLIGRFRRNSINDIMQAYYEEDEQGFLERITKEEFLNLIDE